MPDSILKKPTPEGLTRSTGRAPLDERLRPFRPMPAHYDDLDAVLAMAWECLARGAADRRSGFHTANVATIRADGWPTVRTVVLRRFNRDRRILAFHTDVRTRKFDEIARDPRLTLHFYDPQQKIQMRLDCMAELHAADEITREAWQRSRPMSRACYAQMSHPGASLENGGDAALSALDEAAAYANFAVVFARIEALDWLYLAAAGHRRAAFDWRGPEMTQTWLAP